jgi:hypothetical protein
MVVDHHVAPGWADPDRIGIQGHSYIQRNMGLPCDNPAG